MRSALAILLALLVSTSALATFCPRACREMLATELRTCKAACPRRRPGRDCRLACVADYRARRALCRATVDPTPPACGATTTPTTVPGSTTTTTLGDGPDGSAHPAVWGATLGTTGAEMGQTTAIAPNGDVLLAGDAVGSTFVVRYAPSGARVWQRSFAAPGAASLAGIATDSAGNAYVTGFFTSTITIGTTTLVSAGGLHDIVLFKLDPAGNPVWARRFGSTGDDTAYAVTVDAGDDVVLAAQYDGHVSFGGATFTAYDGGGGDIALAKYTGDGTHVWSRTCTGASQDMARAIVTDPAGNVYLTGGFFSSTNFTDGGTVAGAGRIFGQGSEDIFVAKFDASGSHRWSRAIGSVNNDRGTGVGVFANGDVFVTGYIGGTVANAGGRSLVPSGGINDSFIGRYAAADGAYVWARNFPSSSEDQALSGTVDPATDHAFVTGFFQGTIDFGGGPVSSTASVGGGSEDVYVGAFDGRGAYRWARRYGDGLNQVGTHVALDRAGTRLAVAGYVLGRMDIGSGLTLTSAGLADAFVLGLDP